MALFENSCKTGPVQGRPPRLTSCRHPSEPAAVCGLEGSTPFPQNRGRTRTRRAVASSTAEIATGLAWAIGWYWSIAHEFIPVCGADYSVLPDSRIGKTEGFGDGRRAVPGRRGVPVELPSHTEHMDTGRGVQRVLGTAVLLAGLSSDSISFIFLAALTMFAAMNRRLRYRYFRMTSRALWPEGRCNVPISGSN